MPKPVMRRLLCAPVEHDGVGMSEGDFDKFHRAFKAKLLLVRETELGNNLLELMQASSTMMGERKEVSAKEKRKEERNAKKDKTTSLNSSEAASWFSAEG